MTLYEEYVKKYNNAVKYNKSKKLPNMITAKYDKEDFKAIYEQTKITLKEEGKPSSVHSVMKEMIDRQQFTATKREAEVLVKAMQKRGYSITLDEARAFKGYVAGEGAEEAFAQLPKYLQEKASAIIDFYNEIDMKYHELKQKGYSGAQAKKLISSIFFGS